MEPSMLSDIPYIYLFWLTIFTIGIINLPLTFKLFKQFGDLGYIFSKIVGIIIISYSVWLLSSLHIASFTTTTSITIIILLAIANLLLIKQQIKKKQITLRHLPFKTWAIEELLFTLIFVTWSFIRGYNPEIHGLEKFMDFGFINSILNTAYMPPLDMWLAPSNNPGSYTGGFTINYYYFGHFVTALLTKLSSVPASVSYNLMLGLLCAFTFMGSFSIVANLFWTFEKSVKKIVRFESKKVLACGILGGLLVAFGGNLHTIYAFTKGYDFDSPKPVWEVLGKPNIARYWYPNATRFIPNTIHEFPLYSFIVSDLHGHVLDIPFVLLTIAFLFSLTLSYKKKEEFTGTHTTFALLRSVNNKIHLSFILLLGLFISVMYMTNAWDGIIYFGLSILVFMTLLTQINDRKDYSFNLYPVFRVNILSKNVSIYIPHLLSIIVILGISYIFFSFSFNSNFVPFAKGIGVNCITPNSANQVLCDFSPWWMLLILWGYFYFFVITFFFTVIKPALINTFKNKDNHIQITPSDVFVMLLVIISTGLLIAPELIFARDIYPAHYRANTMFKLGYQAYMMLGISVTYILFRFATINPFSREKVTLKYLILVLIKDPFSGTIKKLKQFLINLWWFAAIVILFLVLLYPFFATNSYYNGLRSYQGLDGLSWLWKIHPGDLATIEYFEGELQEKEQPVILEAVGQSYTDYARISANTGLPTILGWPVHEWLWRGSFDEPGKREREVQQIYESEDRKSAKQLLDTFNVSYVILGKLEREQYPSLNEWNFHQLGEVVFEAGNTKVFKIAR